jgi:dTDP-4-dehydrorhamnose 3,5-epimerase
VQFHETSLPGVFVIEPERREDPRGFFQRTYDREAFAAHGLDPGIVQGSVSFNRRRGTVRGLHFQAAPFEETKLVRASRGSVFDVVVDVRDGSPTRGQHFSVTLTADSGLQVYVPPGFAHGFQTLEDSTEVTYLISAAYSAEHARGFRFDDATLAIAWPEPLTMISDRDLSLPRFGEG